MQAENVMKAVVEVSLSRRADKMTGDESTQHVNGPERDQRRDEWSDSRADHDCGGEAAKAYPLRKAVCHFTSVADGLRMIDARQQTRERACRFVMDVVG